ncbi:MAG: heparinase II/III family protein, partial [Candidatus Glassbacteria bacterium]|nr:heparinase II/III family protein [Candidatus Glassbacteria bacterium]
EWLFFCEVARRCEGIDLYAMAPEFYRNRAVACMFEAYPGIREHNSRRPIPMGDSGGQLFRRERDKALAARRILVSFYRDDPAHQVVHAFNETTPVSGVPGNAYKDFLWRDTAVVKGDLESFKLSHFSPGAGYVYARSSWDENATYFFFKCGDRFTAHQHLDNGHFLVCKYQELSGDGGQYYYFGGSHDVNYLLRTIAHSTVLVHDPAETWSNIRAFKGPLGNDGGQMHDWPHHNGAVVDAAAWEKDRQLYDIADILAFEDRGSYLYLAGDCSRSYRPEKLEYFTRQIVFIRPGTFVVFDRVKSTDPEFRKTWLLQAARTPSVQEPGLVVTNGRGRLSVQTLLPREPLVRLNSWDDLYSYGGDSYPAEQVRGPAPECRVEVSPGRPAAADCFLHVLTAAEAGTPPVPRAEAEESDTEVAVEVAGAKLVFARNRVGGSIEISGQTRPFAGEIKAE